MVTDFRFGVLDWNRRNGGLHRMGWEPELIAYIRKCRLAEILTKKRLPLSLSEVVPDFE
jgi:hypothetical protein